MSNRIVKRSPALLVMALAGPGLRAGTGPAMGRARSAVGCQPAPRLEAALRPGEQPGTLEQLKERQYAFYHGEEGALSNYRKLQVDYMAPNHGEYVPDSMFLKNTLLMTQFLPEGDTGTR